MGYKAKICKACGNTFIPISGRQNYCIVCGKENKKQYDKNYYQKQYSKETAIQNSEEIIYGVKEYIDYSIRDVYIKEIAREMPPSDNDYENIKILLSDFDIIKPIPKFDTYKELNAWKNKEILSALS